MPSGTRVMGKVISSEMTAVDKPCSPSKTSALPVSASSSEKNSSCIGHSLDCRVYGNEHTHTFYLSR